jgi:phosphotransferase system  glucose/maltose/N-acetylglucosamine-specific IIC component
MLLYAVLQRLSNGSFLLLSVVVAAAAAGDVATTAAAAAAVVWIYSFPFILTDTALNFI